MCMYIYVYMYIVYIMCVLCSLGRDPQSDPQELRGSETRHNTLLSFSRACILLCLSHVSFSLIKYLARVVYSILALYTWLIFFSGVSFGLFLLSLFLVTPPLVFSHTAQEPRRVSHVQAPSSSPTLSTATAYFSLYTYKLQIVR